MDPQERIQTASKFLLQSPPGEINDVLNGSLLVYNLYETHTNSVYRMIFVDRCTEYNLRR